jgi:uncharacterized protein (DUF1015 family)
MRAPQPSSPAGNPTACSPGTRPSFYATDASPTTGARSTTGVIGALTLPVAAGAGDVLPHERTLPKAKSDRLALLQATRANLDPIWGLTPATGLPVPAGLPDAETSDDHGVRHSVTLIDDPARIDEIGRVVGSAPLVLADGHHRSRPRRLPKRSG